MYAKDQNLRKTYRACKQLFVAFKSDQLNCVNTALNNFRTTLLERYKFEEITGRNGECFIEQMGDIGGNSWANDITSTSNNPTTTVNGCEIMKGVDKNVCTRSREEEGDAFN